jgi:hypothetical protein
MYAKIRKTASPRATLRYNEEKVEEDKASFILGENFLKDTHQLTFDDKLHRMEDRILLNKGVEKPMMHIFLTFHANDRLSDDLMAGIARKYMDSMGFGEQPYLVYRHRDMPHPHLHIVTVRVREDRSFLKLTRRGLSDMHDFTRTLEREYSLTPNHAATVEEQESFQVKKAQRVVYGKGNLKRAISDVLNTVVEHYKYTTLAELNAALSEWYVKADIGQEGTRQHQHGGLAYYPLDKEGRQTAKGMIASSFRLQPTLPYLEEKFAQNATLREASRQRVTRAIGWTLAGKAPDWEGFQKGMGQEGISVVLQAGKKGEPKEVYFVDHREKAIFSGESLGASYTLSALQERSVERQEVHFHIPKYPFFIY